MSLDYNSPIPLHVQLKEIIERKVAAGDYTDQIPTERKFTEDYHVSRSTVREAINLLVKEGVLEKKHGKGTFVSLKPIQDWLGHLSSTTDTILRMGMKPGARLVSHYITEPSEEIKKITGFTEAYFIKRIRYADEIPIGVERHYYPISIGEKLLSYNLNDATLYDLLENELGIQFAHARQTISNGQLMNEDKDLLMIPPESYVLVAERTIKNQSNEIIEFEEAYYRSDMYSFTINLSRKNG
ncbi:GntR family transcriptional regulator [Oceanobacillus sp. J11TS1]|uniref:GntR family transcriptional regulator n=1 Tax=Oceanobacillus sp. J11TS1 TaxID=2807191 RepID=UPI001AFDA5DB|nr:GntR family transcriptional regulator [Oceanobacillus sp. J11TS1]GIO24128.1 GntR family transcriptional regulator [Oceanobacillus sp. J11TS1]